MDSPLEEAAPPIDVAAAARRQLAVGAALLALVIGVSTAIDALARSETVIGWLDARELAAARRVKALHSPNRGFIDFEERLTLEDIPRIDPSRGGVYFIGSSDLKWGLLASALSPNEARLIHNVGVGATNHAFQDQLVDLLVERLGVLSAGAEKSMFVFATSYHTVAHVYEDNGFFPALWRRHGLYTYSRTEGIGLADVSSTTRWIEVEKARTAGFLREVGAQIGVDAWRLVRDERARVHDPSEYNARWRRHMGPDWETKIDEQTKVFGATASRLQERGAAVSVLLLPQGSWEEDVPFEAAYTRAMKDICAKLSVPLIDMTGAFDDDAFADATHLNVDGQERLSAAAFDLARAHLRRVGALPDPRSEGERH